ncbi:hypothetical protein GCM10023149_49290 [Mucilaginibacter gynuensis]|uniref:Protein involved in gliding motility RemB n=1 Tax=Mucilaginibacter gynuensis TaxID=1302236 RepID=A0ABP8HGB3_9SPHI
MQKTYAKNLCKLALASAALLLTATQGYSQTEQLPYQYQLYQKFNADVYSVKNTAHTALKPLFIDSTLQQRYNELMDLNKRHEKWFAEGIFTMHKSWAGRKLFDEHLIQVNDKDYTFYFDVLSENILGHDLKESSAEAHSAYPNDKTITFAPFGAILKSRIGLNTRGFQLGGTIGKKFSFYTSGYENQAKFARYYDQEINGTGIVPGQAFDRKFGRARTKDWSYVTAVMSYMPIKELTLTLGQDKTFIGDGYRSLFLSDYASNYPLFRATVNLGPFQYMAMWAYMQDYKATRFDSFGATRRKWAAFHYLDWNITNRVSLGLFNAYMAAEADVNGEGAGFDVNYFNPLFFSSSIGPSKQPGNSIAGISGKYKFIDKNAIYGQLVIDRFKASDFFNSKNGDNTNGWQLGVRGADLFGVRNLNYLAEYNTVKPYTYSHPDGFTTFTQLGEPLAHPYGANFREILGILNYTIGNFDFQGQVIHAKYGLDASGTDALNYGKDINKPFTPAQGATTSVGQGISTTMQYAEGTISYMVNPKYNLRLEVGALYRHEKNALATNNTMLLTLGIRSSFRNLYHDF